MKVDVFEKDDKREYKTSVLIERVEFCGSKKNTETKEEAQDNEEFPW
nr:MAG TPA: Single-stranded DNA-binding protein [Caudoviricetes sp.]